MLPVGVINKAIEEADKSTYKFHLGAVIFNKKRILGYGHNGIRSSSCILDKYKRFYNSLHAEQSALMGLDWCKVKGCSILVLKVSKVLKNLTNAMPCDMCLNILNHVGIKNIYYSNDDGGISYLKL